MTIINQMIAQAKQKPRPKELTIAADHVGTVARHFVDNWRWASPLGWEQFHENETRRQILNGELQMMGIPVRVIGKEAA